MSRYLAEVIRSSTSPSSDGLSWSTYEEKRRFLYSLGSNGVPQLILSQRLGESQEGTSSEWQNDQLISYSIQPEKVDQVRVSLNPGDASVPYGASFEQQSFSDHGLELSVGSYYLGDDGRPARSSSNLVLDRSASTITFVGFDSERSPQAEAWTLYYTPGTTKLRVDSATGPVAMDLTVIGDQVSGYGISSTSYAPYLNLEVNTTSQSDYRYFPGSFDEISNRNIALDLLGFSGDGFSEALHNAALNIVDPATFRSGLFGMMRTSSVDASPDYNSDRVWTYENNYPVTMNDVYSGRYVDGGQSYSYSGRSLSTASYSAAPKLIAQELTASELVALRSAISAANATYLIPNNHPSVDLSLFPGGSNGSTIPSFGMVLVPAIPIATLLASVPAAIGINAGQPKDLAPTDGATINVSAPGWSETIQLIRISQASESGSRMQTRQPEDGFSGVMGSLIVGGAGNDVITGGRGWDIVDGGAGDDLIKTGNGRDILQGGLGSDELWGAFGWNTYRSERDGFVDRIVIRSDQLLSNHLYGKAGNNPDGSKADVIEGLDANDLIVIQGATTAEITVQAGASAHGLSGIGIYAQGFLEALYIGGDLSTAQLQAMVSGDNSQGAIDNTIFSYGSTWG